jgi:DNA-binding NarL/FixJ family response regulator
MDGLKGASGTRLDRPTRLSPGYRARLNIDLARPEQDMKRARVVLVEDHAAVAEHLRVVLNPQFDVVAMVTDGYGMVGASMVLKPDVIVADIAMPGMDGIAAATWILKADPKARIVFVTVHQDPELMQRAMEIGALGYVLKLAAGEDLLPAIEAALQGQRHVSPTLGPTNTL